jgi:hypothetical protein
MRGDPLGIQLTVCLREPSFRVFEDQRDDGFQLSLGHV